MVYADSVCLLLAYLFNSIEFSKLKHNFHRNTNQVLRYGESIYAQINRMLSTTFLIVVINFIYFSLLLTKNQKIKSVKKIVQLADIKQ